MSSLRKPEELFKWLTVDLSFSATEPLKLAQFTRLCRGSLHLLLHLISIHLIGVVPTSRIRSELHRLQALSLSRQLPDPMRSLLFPPESSFASYHRTHAQVLRLCDKIVRAQQDLNAKLALAQDKERSRHKEKEISVRQSARLKVLEETKTRWIETWDRFKRLEEMNAVGSESTTALNQATLQKMIDQLDRFVEPATRLQQHTAQYPSSLESVDIRDLFEPLNEWISRANQQRKRAERHNARNDDTTLEMDHLSDTLFDLHRLHIELASRSSSRNRSSLLLSSDKGSDKLMQGFVDSKERNHRRKLEEKLKIKLETRYGGDQNKVHKKMKSILQKVQCKTDIALGEQIDQTLLEAIMSKRPADAVKLNKLKEVKEGREERKLYLDALDAQWRKITRDINALLQVHERLIQSIFQHTQSIDGTYTARDQVLDATRLSVTGLKDELENQVNQMSKKEYESPDKSEICTKDNLEEDVFGKLADLTFEEKLSMMERALRERAIRTKMIDSLNHFREALSAAKDFVGTNASSSTENSHSLQWTSQLDKLHGVLSQGALDVKQANKELNVYRHEMDTLMTGKLNQRGKKQG